MHAGTSCVLASDGGTVTYNWLRFSYSCKINQLTRSEPAGWFIISGKSPDIIQIENVWGTMVWEAYQKERKPFSMSELQIAVIKAWDIVSVTLHASLVPSSPKRGMEVF